MLWVLFVVEWPHDATFLGIKGIKIHKQLANIHCHYVEVFNQLTC